MHENLRGSQIKMNQDDAIVIILKESNIIDEENMITGQFWKKVKEKCTRMELGLAVIQTLNYLLSGQKEEVRRVVRSYFINIIYDADPRLRKSLDRWRVEVGEECENADMKYIKDEVSGR